MKQMGFKESGADPCVFIREENDTHLDVYVDDLILLAETSEEIENEEMSV